MNQPSEIINASFDAEDSLLGAILIDATNGSKQAINKAKTIVNPGDFHQYNNRLIFTAMLACKDAPHQINVARQMLNMGILEDGCVSQMSHCISITPTHLDYQDYADAVREYSQRHRGDLPIKAKGMTE